MTAIDLAALLAPTSAAPPCGPPIEYDEQYLDLERLARGVTQEEDAEGKVVREAEEPDWHEVERIALDLCAKAKDLRVAIYLGRAELALTGLPGFADVVALIAGYLLHGLWDVIHELHAHAGLSIFKPGQTTAIPLAYGAFCPTYDSCMAGYFFTRRAHWNAAWTA